MNVVTVLLFVVLFFQGCTYAISPALTDKADKAITFEMLRTDPNLYAGKVVILGGVIAQIAAVKQGTLITVVQKPLDYWGKPVRTNKAGGYFLVFYPRHLDSLTYDSGRELTVAAEVGGTKLKVLGDTEYDYPVLASKELKLWPREQTRPGTQTQWGDPLYDPQRQPY
jgi:outer membrane lipoprotein